jgi:hypothetical protein
MNAPRPDPRVDHPSWPFGVPRKYHDAMEFRDVILTRKKLDDSNPAMLMDRTNALVTEKSLGLMQADGILAAVAALYPAKDYPDLAPWAIGVLIVSLISACLLLLNLRIKWARDKEVYRHDDVNFAFSWRSLRMRAVFFNVAMVLTGIAMATAIVTSVFALVRTVGM